MQSGLDVSVGGDDLSDVSDAVPSVEAEVCMTNCEVVSLIDGEELPPDSVAKHANPMQSGVLD